MKENTTPLPIKLLVKQAEVIMGKMLENLEGCVKMSLTWMLFKFPRLGQETFMSMPSFSKTLRGATGPQPKLGPGIGCFSLCLTEKKKKKSIKRATKDMKRGMVPTHTTNQELALYLILPLLVHGPM